MTTPTAGTALDRNTGLPVSLQGLGFTEESTVINPGRTDTGTTTQSQTQSGTSSSIQTVDMKNSTPTAIAALDAFITQMMGGSIPGAPGGAGGAGGRDPTAVFPDAVPYWDREKGWLYQNVYTGLTMAPNEVAQFNAAQAEKRAQYAAGEIDASGKPATGTINPTTSGAPGTAGATGTTGQIGTPSQIALQNERFTEITRNREFQGDYSKGAAKKDAQALMDKALHDALEKALPQITAQSEGAGTSKSSMGALLTQRAAEGGAREGAALGAQLGVSYGQLNNQLASTLELLTRADPNSPENLLLQAILGSKGIVQSGTTSTVGSSTSSGTSVGNTTNTQGPSTQTTIGTKNPNMPISGFTPQNPTQPNQQPSNPYFAIGAGNPNAISVGQGNASDSLFNIPVDPNANALYEGVF